jgi:hypothetical protein
VEVLLEGASPVEGHQGEIRGDIVGLEGGLDAIHRGKWGARVGLHDECAGTGGGGEFCERGSDGGFADSAFAQDDQHASGEEFVQHFRLVAGVSAGAIHWDRRVA